jgi:hypothetical protein
MQGNDHGLIQVLLWSLHGRTDGPRSGQLVSERRLKSGIFIKFRSVTVDPNCSVPHVLFLGIISVKTKLVQRVMTTFYVELMIETILPDCGGDMLFHE